MSNHESYPCPQNVNQLTLAEDLCADCSKRAAKRPARGQDGKVRKAWNSAELAIATPDEQARLRAFSIARETIASLLRQEISFTTQNRALVLKGLLPAVLDRSLRQPLQLESKRHANRGFGEVLVNRFYRHITDNEGEAPEALALYLLSREGTDINDFYYGASWRENNNGPSQQKRLNHDMYQLWETSNGRSVKLPVQLKATTNPVSKYDVPVLAIKPTLAPVLSLIGENSLDPIMNMAARERLGETNDYEEVTLDFATHCLQTSVTNLKYKKIVKALKIGTETG